MTKDFSISNGIVFATVVTVPCYDYFFAQNGEPGQIMCHINDGGTLTNTPLGNIVLDQNQEFDMPKVGQKVVLLRASTDTTRRDYTKARRWALESEWLCVKWGINAQLTYRAICHDHRNRGMLQSNSREIVELERGRLIDLVNKYQGRDPYGTKLSAIIGGRTISSKIGWQRHEADGAWTTCECPLPFTN
jgi:hypothetical protein